MTQIGGVVNNGEDRTAIQSDLGYFISWAHSKKMCFETVKCQVLHPEAKSAARPLRTGGCTLGTSGSAKDFGEPVDNCPGAPSAMLWHKGLM